MDRCGLNSQDSPRTTVESLPLSQYLQKMQREPEDQDSEQAVPLRGKEATVSLPREKVLVGSLF